jgi:hypothetical protein
MLQQPLVPLEKRKTNKISKLIISIVLDLIGMLSYTIPIIAEATDIIWAPIAAFIMVNMYKGSIGKIGSVIAFIEEIFPGLDFIPTFTITWMYEYYITNKNKK